MAIYEIETDDGQTYEIETDEAPQKSTGQKVLEGAKKVFDMTGPGMLLKGGKMVQKGADLAGEKAAEFLAEKGTNPNAAAAIGTGIQMIPDIAGSMDIGAKAAESTVAKALTKGGRGAIGEEIGAAEKAAGITQQIPTVSNFSKKLNLPTRERGFADILNTVKKKIDAGEKMEVQDLADFRDLVKQQYGANKIAKGTKMDAIAAQTNKQATDLLNKLIPARQKASMSYAKIKKIQDGLKTLAKAGAGASGLGLAGALVKSLMGK